MEYLTIKDEFCFETEVKKSRFIAYLKPITCVEEANSFIQKVSKQNYDATHNVWAYIIKSDQEVKRYSDDGEPQGTAGIPCLEVLSKNGLFNICVVVTRYFGGTMLGAGGLVRAYSNATKQALEHAQIITMSLCQEASVCIDYSQYSQFNSTISKFKHKIIQNEYNQDIRIIFLIKSSEFDGFLRDLIEFMNGDIDVKKEEKYFFQI